LEFMYHVMYPPSKVLRQMGNNSFLNSHCPIVLVVACAGHETINFLEITGNGMPLVFASWTVPHVFRIARFHDSFGYVLTLVHCGLKLITAINFFDVGMCSSPLAATRAMISQCSQFGWHGFCTWISKFDLEFWMGFLPLFLFRAGSGTSSIGCEEPAKRNVASIYNLNLKNIANIISKIEA